ncbi:hypothetical protein AVCANL283_08830, partial [Campylobacter canadensis]
VVKFAQNVSTLLGDFQSYYTSQGQLADKIKTMTNVAIKESGSKGIIQVKAKDCLTITLDKTNSLITFTKAADVDTTNPVCKKVLAMDNISQMLSSSNPCTGLGATASNGSAALSAEETAFGCEKVGTAKTWSIKDGEVRFAYAASGVKW